MSKMFIGPIDIADAGTDADQDIFVLATSSAQRAILHHFELTSDVTSAAAIKLELVRRSGAGTGGTAVTEEDLDETDDATAATAMTTDAETPGAGIAVLANWLWEQLGPQPFSPTPPMQVAIAVSGFLALNSLTSFANAAVGGYAVWEEP